MKILMLTPYLPYPLLSGGQIRSFNLLKNLSKRHDITLFSFIREESEKKHIKFLKQYCNNVKVFKKRRPWSGTSLMLSGVTVYPLVVCLYLKSNVKREIQKAIEREHFDIIHAETFYVMPNIPKNNIPTILVEQTIEYLVYKHFTDEVKNPLVKPFMRYDVRKILHWEKRFWQVASRVVAMSEADRQSMENMLPGIQVDLVPNGVDTSFFTMRKRPIRRNKIILFVGNFKWLQNREAAVKLVKEIWPKIKKGLPHSKLWIVGRFPPKQILNFASDSIIISSDIEDIRKAYYGSDVMLAPIYGPGGTRYKILESMAAGLPVVTTKTGIEGLGATDGLDALIGSTQSQLAEKTVRVLRDEKLAQVLAQNGRKLVKSNYNWQSISEKLDRIYKKAANERTQ